MNKITKEELEIVSELDKYQEETFLRKQQLILWAH